VRSPIGSRKRLRREAECIDGIDDEDRGCRSLKRRHGCADCTGDGVCGWDADAEVDCGIPVLRKAGWSSGGIGGGGEAEVDARPLARPCEPKVKPDEGEGMPLNGRSWPCSLLEFVTDSSSCWETVDGVPRFTCEGDRDCESERETEVPRLGAGESRPCSPKSVRCGGLSALRLFRPKVDHPTAVEVVATLVVDVRGLAEPERRVINRRVRVGGWDCAVKGIGTGTSGRSSRWVSVGGGRETGLPLSRECLRVLGRRAVENGTGVEVVLAASLALATGSGGVQFATRESRSGWILRSSGKASAAEALGCVGAVAGVVGRVGPGDVKAEAAVKLVALPRLKRARRFAIHQTQARYASPVAIIRILVAECKASVSQTQGGDMRYE
jgi:hypothetical protein